MPLPRRAAEVKTARTREHLLARASSEKMNIDAFLSPRYGYRTQSFSRHSRKAPRGLHCGTCDVTVGKTRNSYAMETHLAGRPHTNATAHWAKVLNSVAQWPGKARWYCSACRQSMHPYTKVDHCATKRHARAVGRKGQWNGYKPLPSVTFSGLRSVPFSGPALAFPLEAPSSDSGSGDDDDASSQEQPNHDHERGGPAGHSRNGEGASDCSGRADSDAGHLRARGEAAEPARGAGPSQVMTLDDLFARFAPFKGKPPPFDFNTDAPAFNRDGGGLEVPEDAL
ncbi:hypothetical protein B0H12DRAFT_1077271 [Mycena haematopus]|nr:hypothetical protein B0H12DRAFT_1077271 [Mycena haematopus]